MSLSPPRIQAFFTQKVIFSCQVQQKQGCIFKSFPSSPPSSTYRRDIEIRQPAVLLSGIRHNIADVLSHGLIPA